MNNDIFSRYLDAVERAVGFPYAEVVVSVVEDCFNKGCGVDECANILLKESEPAIECDCCGRVGQELEKIEFGNDSQMLCAGCIENEIGPNCHR